MKHTPITRDLFPETNPPRQQQRRRANRIHTEPAVMIRYELTADERACLKWNEPGPSGVIGGYQQFENRLIGGLDHHPETTVSKYVIELDATDRDRLTRYIQLYGGGGPNKRIRQAFARFFSDGAK
jgi:hypothetical protein